MLAVLFLSGIFTALLVEFVKFSGRLKPQRGNQTLGCVNGPLVPVNQPFWCQTSSANLG
ncbi:MAG: hypothetical protein KME19_00050 [Microcoleus vaginatus WJT46-NPBG5]|nr:hypothetical protein [Microcoleus vaginatus WJT46-NPBG5]